MHTARLEHGLLSADGINVFTGEIFLFLLFPIFAISRGEISLSRQKSNHLQRRGSKVLEFERLASLSSRPCDNSEPIIQQLWPRL